MTHSAKMPCTRMPTNRMIAKSPLCATSPPHRALKTTENTKVYTASINNGLKNDHARPINEPR